MDWMSQAAREATAHLKTRLQPRFGSKSWTQFSSRLNNDAERLFRLLHGLYGWRYDFAWIYEQMVETAAEGYLGRSKSLRRVDRESTAHQAWLSDPKSLWAEVYIDRSARGLRDRFDHLESLGVSHLHLLLGKGHGPNQKLTTIATELGERGLNLVLDLVCNHVASDHPWAKAAAAGHPMFKSFFFAFPDRTIPDSYAPHLRSVNPDRDGDAFTWHPEMDGGNWVWTTFDPGQWDLDYSNPDVLAAIAGEVLVLANLGASVIRLDSLSFLWKKPGTVCENLPEAHLVVEVLHAIAGIVAPSVTLMAGAAGDFDGGLAFIRPTECRVGHNSLLMSSVWEALASTDTRLLAQALGERFRIPPGCTWLAYLRSHDDIAWAFDDDDAYALGINPRAHREYLDSFYRGVCPASTVRGQSPRENPGPRDPHISGTVASLAGLEAAVEHLDQVAIESAVRRIMAAFAIVLGAGGVPMILLGDEIAQLSEQNYPSDPGLAGGSRWSHRPVFDPARLESAEAGVGAEGAVLAGLRRLLELRRGLEGFGPDILPDPISLGEQALIAFRRGPVLVIVNVANRPVIVARSGLPDGDLFDLVSRDIWDGHVLGPYEYRYVAI